VWRFAAGRRSARMPDMLWGRRMQCPKCSQVIPPDSARCVCGYGFVSSRADQGPANVPKLPPLLTGTSAIIFWTFIGFSIVTLITAILFSHVFS